MPNVRTLALATALGAATLLAGCKKDAPEKLPPVHHTAKAGAAVQQGNATGAKTPNDTTHAAAGKAAAGKMVVGKTPPGAKQQPGGIAPSNVPPSKVPVTTPPASKVPASKVPVATPPANAGVAAKGAAPATKGTATAAKTTAPATSTTTVAARDSAKVPRGAAKPSADSAVRQPILRESFSYDASGRRDPFASLMNTTELRPAISDLRLTGILYDPSGRRPIAIMRDLQTRAQYRVTTGMTLGRMRVAQIKPHSVIFSIEEFGMNRQDSLVLGDSTKVRIP